MQRQQVQHGRPGVSFPGNVLQVPLGIQSIPYIWVYPYQLDVPGNPAGP